MRIDRKKLAGYAKLVGRIVFELVTVVILKRWKGKRLWK